MYDVYPLSHLIGLLWTLCCFPLMPPILNSVEGSISVLHAVCILQAHGKDSYDLEFSNSRHGSFIGKSRKPTCSTWQSSAWRSQSQSQTSCWIYWQRDCLPRSACTDLWGGASLFSPQFVAWKLRQACLRKLYFGRLTSSFLWSSFRSTNLCHLQGQACSFVLFVRFVPMPIPLPSCIPGWGWLGTACSWVARSLLAWGLVGSPTHPFQIWDAPDKCQGLPLLWTAILGCFVAAADWLSAGTGAGTCQLVFAWLSPVSRAYVPSPICYEAPCHESACNETHANGLEWWPPWEQGENIW